LKGQLRNFYHSFEESVMTRKIMSLFSHGEGVHPPSTGIDVPFTNNADSLKRKFTTFAISSDRPKRTLGI
jgi:hypothetical protein